MHLSFKVVFAFLLAAERCYAFVPRSLSFAVGASLARPACQIITLASAPSEKSTDATASLPAPTLDGKRVLPYRILTGSLNGQEPVAAVYAVLGSDYQRGQDGWNSVLHVGVSQDLMTALKSHVEKHGAVANVRALSFAIPQPNAMQKIASDWKELAQQAGASLQDWGDDVLGHLYDDEDDDEDDYSEMPAAMDGTTNNDIAKDVISPFTLPSVSVTNDDGNFLAFTVENVDKVLDEVRPYLIADGGNVAVDRVDSETRNVYLKLEGACGSCPSSTVTMQMGVERVLRENFADLNQVLQVSDKPTELTWAAVELEANRLSSAIVAMGGVMKLLDADPASGVVKILFKGPKRVQQGLELALRDVEYVTDVQFTDQEE